MTKVAFIDYFGHGVWACWHTTELDTDAPPKLLMNNVSSLVNHITRHLCTIIRMSAAAEEVLQIEGNFRKAHPQETI